MKRFRLTTTGLVAVLFTMASSGCGDDTGGSSDELRIDDAWVRSTPAVVDNAALYMTITSPIDDRLTKVTVDDAVAARATLHETVTSGAADASAGSGAPHDDGHGDDDTSKLTTMERREAIELPAGVPVEFSPGEKHIMLEGLTGALEAGDTVDVTLELDEAGTHQVEVDVLDQGPDEAGDS